MRKISALLVLLVSLSLPAFSAETVDLEIGDEIITFSIPDDPLRLKAFYLELLKMYALSENNNIVLEAKIKEYMAEVDKLTKESSKVVVQIETVVEKVTEYIEIAEKPSLYAGPMFGINKSFPNLETVYTIGGVLSYRKNNTIYSLQIPLSITTAPANRLDIGVTASITFRI